MRRGVNFAGSLIALFLATDAVAQDTCLSKIPADLAAQLRREFPNHVLPRVSDNDQVYVRFEKSQGRNGCLGVARGDFDGNHQLDIAVLLSVDGGNDVKLIAALRRGRTWALFDLPFWCSHRTDCFVERGRLGTFERHISFDGPLTHPDERKSMTTRLPVIVAGKLESTGIAYAFSNGKWSFVWFSG